MPAPRGRRGLGHRTVSCDRASYQQAAEGRVFHPDLRSGLRVSHSAAIDANPATCCPLAWRRHRVVFGGSCPVPPYVQGEARGLARTSASAVDLVPAQHQLPSLRACALHHAFEAGMAWVFRKCRRLTPSGALLVIAVALLWLPVSFGTFPTNSILK